VTSHGDDQEQPKKRRCSASWARLISKVFQADPLVCKRCGGPLKVVAYITDSVTIRQILDCGRGASPSRQEEVAARRRIGRVRATDPPPARSVAAGVMRWPYFRAYQEATSCTPTRLDENE